MGNGDRAGLGKWLWLSRSDVCLPGNMLLATGCFVWGFLFVYGFEHFGVGFKVGSKILGGLFLAASIGLSVLYLHRYFRDRSMTYWGGGLALLLAVLPLSLSLGDSDPVVCHRSTAKLIVLVFAFVGGPLSIYGLFHMAEHKTQERQAAREKRQADDSTDEAEGVDKEELKNFTLLLTLFLALFVFGKRLIMECLS